MTAKFFELVWETMNLLLFEASATIGAENDPAAGCTEIDGCDMNGFHFGFGSGIECGFGLSM